MKRAISLILCAVLAFSLFSCGEKKPEYSLPNDDGRVVICIDPGHGFRDIGCETEYLGYEKDMTVLLAEALKTELEAAGALVILTHDGKSFPTVAEITKEASALGIAYDPAEMEENDLFGKYERAIWENVLAEKYSLDMFVSLHVNSIEDPAFRGASVDYCSENPYTDLLRHFSDSLSKALTEKNISADFRIYEDVPEEAYVVTKYASVPSVLIEAGYATNPDDAAQLLDEKWRESFAEALCGVMIGTIEP